MNVGWRNGRLKEQVCPGRSSLILVDQSSRLSQEFQEMVVAPGKVDVDEHHNNVTGEIIVSSTRTRTLASSHSKQGYSAQGWGTARLNSLRPPCLQAEQANGIRPGGHGPFVSDTDGSLTTPTLENGVEGCRNEGRKSLLPSVHNGASRETNCAEDT